MAVIQKHIKLKLNPKYHGDVIRIIASIEPGKLAGTIVQLLRLYPQLSKSAFQLQQPSVSTERVEPIEPDTTEEKTTPKATKPVSRVSLDVGFDALND